MKKTILIARKSRQLSMVNTSHTKTNCKRPWYVYLLLAPALKNLPTKPISATLFLLLRVQIFYKYTFSFCLTKGDVCVYIYIYMLNKGGYFF